MRGKRQTLEELMACNLEEASPERVARICELLAQRLGIRRDDIVPDTGKLANRLAYGFPDWCQDEHKSRTNTQIIKDFESKCYELVALSATAPTIVEYSNYKTSEEMSRLVPRNLVLHRPYYYRKDGEPIHNIYVSYLVDREQLKEYVRSQGGDDDNAPYCHGHQYYWNQPVEHIPFDRQRWADELGDVHG